MAKDQVITGFVYEIVDIVSDLWKGSDRLTGETIGDLKTGEQKVYLNRTMFLDNWGLGALLEVQEKNPHKWSVLLDSSSFIRSIAAHEIGHCAYDLYVWKYQNPSIAKLFPTATAENLSEYGTENVDEMAAEAWTEWRLSSDVRPFATSIVSKLSTAGISRFTAGNVAASDASNSRLDKAA